jgi:hypothetical protein
VFREADPHMFRRRTRRMFDCRLNFCSLSLYRDDNGQVRSGFDKKLSVVTHAWVSGTTVITTLTPVRF